MRTLRIPCSLLLVGYLGVIAGAIGYSATFTLGKQGWIEVLYEPVGVGLAGFASWRWMVASRTEPTATTKTIKVPTRIMAISCVVFAAGQAVFAHIVAQEHSSPGLADASFHYSTKMAGVISSGIGFLLAATGFWLASLDAWTAPTPTTQVAVPVP